MASYLSGPMEENDAEIGQVDDAVLIDVRARICGFTLPPIIQENTKIGQVDFSVAVEVRPAFARAAVCKLRDAERHWIAVIGYLRGRRNRLCLGRMVSDSDVRGKNLASPQTIGVCRRGKRLRLAGLDENRDAAFWGCTAQKRDRVAPSYLGRIGFDGRG